MEKEYLLLKWGTIKAWDLHQLITQNLMKEYLAIGSSLSVMTQIDTTRQKHIICMLIDSIIGDIQNDWTGEFMNKEEAKKYIMEYDNG